MALTLREPKRKHRGSAPDKIPFPILTERATGIPVCEATWRTYTGRFNGDSVVVEKLEDISALYFMGYYGKGSLSRGCAILGREKRKQPPFLKERQWLRHELWMEMAASNSEREAPSTVAGEKQSKPLCQHGEVRKDTHHSGESSGSKTDNAAASRELPAAQNITVIDDADSECSDVVEVDKSGKASNSSRKHDREPDCEVKIEKDAKRRKSSDEKKTEQSDIEVVDLSSDEDCSRPNPNGKCVKNLAKPLNAVTATIREARSSSVIDSSNCEEVEVVVLSDIDSDNEDCLSNLRPRLEFEPTYLAREKLVLSLEEAMFLSYGLGCLKILGLTGQELSLSEIWELFQESQKSFVQRYIAYHYFRSRGWVVKSGLKFGGDFALYKDGPHLYHSSYIVVVEVINQGSCMRDNSLSGRPMTWTQLMGLARLSEGAGKEVLICQVVWPEEVPKGKVPSPRVVSLFQVHETLLRRWIPTQDRLDHHKDRDDGGLNEGNSTEIVTA